MSVKRLQELGFKESDCIKALQATSGRLEASATWLLENATPIIQAQSSHQEGSAQGWQFAGFEVRGGLLLLFRDLHNVCVIPSFQHSVISTECNEVKFV